MKKKMIQTIIIVTFIISSAISAIGDELTSSKKTDIIKLIDITGTVNLSNQLSEAISKQMVDNMKRSKPDIPKRVLQIVHEQAVSVFNEQLVVKGGLIDRLIPIYSRYFTHNDIKSLLIFYKSDIGIKSVKIMPLAMQETMNEGKKWGESLYPLLIARIENKCKAEGYDINRY